ncbi:MAG TPA: nodulation protein NfeD [Chloroflexota bacterium]|nr:nodulation protein NfeD [Chloroflexota bacterium]
MKAALLAGLVFLAGVSAASAAGSQVDVITLNAAINPITANYVEHGLQQAQQDGAAAAVIEMDTPGGLDSAMRQIVRDMTSSSAPVVVFVGPPGARAGSAGVFITMASDVAVMAPNTNIGAAHPVGLGIGGGAQPSAQATAQPGQQAQPQSDTDVEAQKVLNDSVAYIRSLAENHGRNADWAEQAVRNSVSVTDQQAVQQHIVDLEANDLPDLLAKLDGRTVKLSNGSSVTLHTAGAAVKRLDMSPFEDLLSYIADPTVAYLLMLVGVYGVIFELASPGAIMPGVLGGLALILGLLSLGTLPVNYAGLALMLFSFLLFIADVKVPTHGILTAGGVLSFLLGSFALFNAGQSGLSIAIPVILVVTAGSALFFGTVVRLGVRARKAVPTTGTYELVGKVGKVQTDLKPDGRIVVNGEWWKATSDEPLEAGTPVEVLDVKGLTLLVKRAA